MRIAIHSMLALAAISTPGAALAADHEVSFELGTFGSPDSGYNLFSISDSVPTRGIRLGVAVHDQVSVILGWHHGHRGSRVFGYDYYDEADHKANFKAAFQADQFSLGAKADWPMVSWLKPYATLQALGYRGVVRFDDDPSRTDNPNQIQASAFSPGAVATIGGDLIIPLGERLSLGSYMELGYGYATPFEFTSDDIELGSFGMSGLVFRIGAGARF